MLKSVDAAAKPQTATRRSAALAAIPRSVGRKAKRLRLSSNMSIDDAVALVFGECLKHWTANESVTHRGVDPEGIHEMRVGLRRMRSALSDFREIIPAAQFAWMKRESKWLITSLGAARNWDVFLSELLEPIERACPRDAGLSELRTAALVERGQGYATARMTIRSSRYSKFVAHMRAWLSSRRWRQGGKQERKPLDKRIEKFAGRVLNKRHRAALKLGRDFDSLSPDERHHLRIALKKLRYTSEFFRSLYPKKSSKPYLRALAVMQTCLGHMNDVVVAEHLLGRLATVHERERRVAHLATAAGVIVGWHAHGAAAYAQQAEENWREFRNREVFW
jgi:triphosphatase